MTPRTTLFLLALLLVGGCGTTAGVDDKPGGSPPTTSKQGETPSPDTTIRDETARKPLPAALQHEGFRYSGLGAEKATRFAITRSDVPEPTVGEQSAEATSVGETIAMFSVRRTGGLAGFGTETLSVERDGVYLVSTSAGKIDKMIVFPADFKVGAEWKTKATLETAAGQKMRLEGTYRVVRSEKVDTPTGKVDALLVTSEGSGDVDGKKLRVTGKTWYARDIGQIKMELETNMEGAAPQKMSVRLAE